jgi:hypothetical protein
LIHRPLAWPFTRRWPELGEQRPSPG